MKCEPQQSVQGRFSLLDPVRGFAAAWVFLFHHHFTESFQSTFPVLHSAFKLGDRAVPLFFVISGYCIGLASHRAQLNQQSPWSFLKKRCWRIYPTLWCAILTILAFRVSAVVLIKFNLASRLSGSLWPMLPRYSAMDWIGVCTLTRALVVHGDYFWGRFGEVNGAFWTLAIEMQFYVTVVCLMSLKKWYHPALFALTCLSFVAWFHEPLFVSSANFGSFLPFWSWFAYGLALWSIQNRGWTPHSVLHQRATIVCGAVLTMMLFGLIACSYATVAIDSQLFAALSAVAIWCLMAFENRFQMLAESDSVVVHRVSTGLIALGTASFTIYLLHNEVSHFLSGILQKIPGVSGVVLDCCIVAGTLAVTFGLFRIIERPFLKKRAPRTGPVFESPSLPAASGLVESRQAA